VSEPLSAAPPDPRAAPPDGPQASAAATHRVAATRRHGAAFQDARTWYALAEQRPGSWWPTWQRWLGEQSGKRRPVVAWAGKGGRVVLGDAPGDYVHGN